MANEKRLISVGDVLYIIGKYSFSPSENPQVVEVQVAYKFRKQFYACCWDDGNVEFMLKNKTESFGIAYAAYPCMEVIGNIHDNPELLEVE